ncbi:MAG: GNAT family N-acetyltransferase [Bacteroidota bacterium]
MISLTFKAMDESGIPVLDRWFDHSTLFSRLEPPTLQWLTYVRSTPGVFAWMVYDDSETIGHVQVDTEINGLGSVALVVNPAVQNKGYGRAILGALFERPELVTIKGLEGYVEQDNLPAQQCCLAAGFRATAHVPDKDGFLRYVKLQHLPIESPA